MQNQNDSFQPVSGYTDDDGYHWVPRRFAHLIDDPGARFRLRQSFYRKYGGVSGANHSLLKRIAALLTRREGLGISELNFLQWEIKRKVLNPLNHTHGRGSPWWRKVNLALVVNAQIASELVDAKREEDSAISNEVRLWIDYIHEKSPRSWYRAHNGSIVRAYLDFREEAVQETVYEQTFMNEVLYRVLYAQAMVDDETVFGEVGHLAANPMLPSVDLMVHLPAFYPVHYPLSREDIVNIMHQGHSLQGEIEREFDEYLIYPHIPALYSTIARQIQIPELNLLHAEGKPIYPDIKPQKE